MIRSKYFWLGAIIIAIIPLMIMDISEYFVAWEKEVRGRMIDLAQNYSGLPKMQKAGILDNIFEVNQKLTRLIAIKAFISLVLFSGGIYFLRKFRKTTGVSFLKPALTTLGLIVVFIVGKVVFTIAFTTQQGATFVNVDADSKSFKDIISRNFKGKVVYVDFWGTTCGPCLEEFDNFTQPLKQHYKNRSDIAYLYIANGSNYLWKKQIVNHKITGNHLFLDLDAYSKLYHQAAQNDTAMILMPHYVIVDRAGKITSPDAARPSDYTVLVGQLDKVLGE
ncbi:MAG: redoxin family protein [Mucilaginibacter sp.]|nr:redoxin family protein [Mucilaginibacter sp.]